MFRDNTLISREPVNIIFDDGGLGDNICRLSAVKYIKDTYKHVDLYVYVPDYFLDLAKHLIPGPGVTFKKFSEAEQNWNKSFASLRTTNPQVGNMRTHILDNAFAVLVDKDVEIEHKNYVQLKLNKISISKFTLPEKYVIITTGYTAEVRELRADVVNSLSDYVLSKGYTPVYLGSKNAPVGVLVTSGKDTSIIGNFNASIDYSKGLDLINKTSLLEAGKIISGATCLLGLDNGLMHLAGCVETPIVGAYTTVEPRYRLPYRHNVLGWNCFVVEPTESLKCRFCQSNFNFVYDHDFRSCYYKEKGLDTEIQCTKSITADKFITHLEKLL